MNPMRPSFVAAMLVVGAGRVAAQQDELRMRIARLGAKVLMIDGFTNGNILVVERDSTLLLVDGQSAKRVSQADSALRTLSTKPVRLVINTHYHDDHTEGNAWWKARGASVLAHPNAVREAMRDTVITELEWNRHHLPPDAMPNVLASDTTFRDEGLLVKLIHPPRAHTSGDLMVWLPELNVLHTGDVIEFGAYPFLDWWGGGTLDGMIGAADRIVAIANRETKIVPGHGPVVTVERVRRYGRMLRTVRARAARSLARGETVGRFLGRRPTREFDAEWAGTVGPKRFLTIVYQGLERLRASKGGG
jgi:cyclase